MAREEAEPIAVLARIADALEALVGMQRQAVAQTTKRVARRRPSRSVPSAPVTPRDDVAEQKAREALRRAGLL